MEVERRAVPLDGHSRPPARVLLRRPRRPQGQELRHRGLVPAPEEVFRGLLLLEPRGRAGPPPENSRQGRGRQDVPAAHAEQHRRRTPAYAHRLPREQSSGRRQRADPRGASALHGRQDRAHTEKVISYSNIFIILYD